MTGQGKSWSRSWALIFPACTLLAAVAAQGMYIFREAPKAREWHLARSIPDSVAGWMGRDVPLGANEFVSNEVEKVLKYDDVVNREFTRGGEMFGVYVAYWGAGKMPTQLVASHTPDRCWTENGMRCLEMKFQQREVFEGTALQPAEWRSFEPARGGAPVYVLYWHLIDGRPYDYGNRFNKTPSPLSWGREAVRQAFLGSGEQFFIRLMSTEPLEQLWNDPGFAEVMRSLGRLGLYATPPESAR